MAKNLYVSDEWIYQAITKFMEPFLAAWPEEGRQVLNAYTQKLLPYEAGMMLVQVVKRMSENNSADEIAALQTELSETRRMLTKAQQELQNTQMEVDKQRKKLEERITNLGFDLEFLHNRINQQNGVIARQHMQLKNLLGAANDTPS